MKARHQFIFRFGQIERNAIGLRKRRDQKYNESQEFRNNVPARNEAPKHSTLRIHNIAQTETARHDQHADE